MIEFFAIFSFFYIVFINIGIIIGVILSIRKRKRAIKDIQGMAQKFNEGFDDLCE